MNTVAAALQLQTVLSFQAWQSTAFGCNPGDATAGNGNATIMPAPPPPPPVRCRHLRLPPQHEAAWAATGPWSRLRYITFFALGAAQCVLAAVVYVFAVPRHGAPHGVRIALGWVCVAARSTTVLWSWVVGPRRTPLLATAADALSYSAVAIWTCLQPRARVPFRDRLVFAAMNGMLLLCGCGTLLMERPSGVPPRTVPILWAVGVRTMRFVDVFTELSFAGLLLEDVRLLLLER